MEQVTSPPCLESYLVIRTLLSKTKPDHPKGRRSQVRAGARGTETLRRVGECEFTQPHGASSKRVHKTELPVIRKSRSWVRTRRKRNRYLENSSPLRGHGSPIHNRRDVDTTSSPWREGGAAHVCSLGQDREGNAAAPASTEGGPKDTVRAGHSTARSHSHVGLEKVELRGPGLGGGLQGERRRSHATRFRLQNYYVPRI